MKELEYPFDSEQILKQSKRIRRMLLADESARTEKRIAVLGGTPTHDVVRILELFLLHYGIRPVFYESEYNMYWQEAMFPGEAFSAFAPDVIYIHTSCRNLLFMPDPEDDAAAVEEKFRQECDRFLQMWDRLRETFHCPVIQCNFEYPPYRLLGNRDAFDIHGRVRYVNEMNRFVADYAREHESFYICDIHYLSAAFGLDAWSDPADWYMYKYAVSLKAVPTLAHNIARIVKSIFGKNKKALALDLDNTLWGGVIGDDGAEGIELGSETAAGEAYADFQGWLKKQKALGILLSIVSKNEEENALAGLRHPDSVLSEEDFVCIRANWEPKSENVAAIAKALNILPESIVFVDDNPAEREIVQAYLPQTAVPQIHDPARYIRTLDRSGFFEATVITADDAARVEMVRENMKRMEEASAFTDYAEYLRSLDMRAEIRPFEEVYFPRIAQLTNKSNQFNLTTKRMTQDEVAACAADKAFITLYGRLMDKFGDNGIVSLVIGRIEEETLHMELWLMSCRVLKRDMEYAMMDVLVETCRERGIRRIVGYYYPTAKNGMVAVFYALQGFERIREEADGATVWQFDIPDPYVYKNEVIAVNSGEGEGGSHGQSGDL